MTDAAPALDIPITISDGNAIAPVEGSSDGFNSLPSQLLVVSVPFEEGDLSPETLVAVCDDLERPLPAERTVLCIWPDGSVRKAQIRFLSHFEFGNDAGVSHHPLPWAYRLRVGQAPNPANPIRLERTGTRILVLQGDLCVAIDSRAHGFGFAQVICEPAGEVLAGPLDLQIDFQERADLFTETLSASECVVEESGALRAVVRLMGAWECLYQGETRLFLQAGETSIESLLRRQIRSVAWSSLGHLRLYDITRNPTYLSPFHKVLEVMKARPEAWMKGGIWQSALQSAFLEQYHRMTDDPEVREIFLRHIDWLLDNYDIPKKRTMGYREGKAEYGYGPESLSAGGSLMVIAAQFGYAYTLTHDLYYLETAYTLLEEGLKNADTGTDRNPAPLPWKTNRVGATRSDGKGFSQINLSPDRLRGSVRLLVRTGPEHCAETEN